MRAISFRVLEFGFQVIADQKRMYCFPQQAYYVVLLVYNPATLCRAVPIVDVLITG